MLMTARELNSHIPIPLESATIIIFAVVLKTTGMQDKNVTCTPSLL